MKTQKKVWESKKNGEFQFLLPFVPWKEGMAVPSIERAEGGGGEGTAPLSVSHARRSTREGRRRLELVLSGDIPGSRLPPLLALLLALAQVVALGEQG